MSFLTPATEDQVTRFETENHISLPAQYKEWLLFSDGGECFLPAGFQSYGVASKPLIDLNDPDGPDDNYVVIGILPVSNRSLDMTC